MTHNRRRTVIAAALTSLFTALASVFTAPLAHAALTPPWLGSADSAFQGLVQSVANSPGSSGQRLSDFLGSAQNAGLADFRPTGPLTSSDGNYPLPTNPNIKETKLVKVTDDPWQRVQRWTVDSPSMQRPVEVQIMLPKDRKVPAPMLYLFDGISGTETSGWLKWGGLEKVFAEENVTIVMPTGASASLYSDWVRDDPALGRYKWETFVTKELAPLLERPEHGLNFNGKRGVAGLSMGAIGAVHMANAHPELFNAVMGLSGCYSTMDPIGRQIAKVMVESRGGNVENMWGPYGSDMWRYHDVVTHPEGLRNMRVYLFTADGTVTQAELDYQKTRPFYELAAGAVLEQGTHQCTVALDQAMRKAGMTHQTVEYKHGGVHSWDLFDRQLPTAWQAIKPSLM